MFLRNPCPRGYSKYHSITQYESALATQGVDQLNTLTLEAQEDITLRGANITANSATLNAIEGDITLLSTQNTQATQSESSSQGSSIGVGVSTENGAQLTLSANQAAASKNSQSTQNNETLINTQHPYISGQSFIR